MNLINAAAILDVSFICSTMQELDGQRHTWICSSKAATASKTCL